MSHVDQVVKLRQMYIMIDHLHFNAWDEEWRPKLFNKASTKPVKELTWLTPSWTVIVNFKQFVDPKNFQALFGGTVNGNWNPWRNKSHGIDPGVLSF